MAVLGEKIVTSGLEKGDIPKTTRYNPRILYFCMHLLGANSTVPKITGFDKVEIMMTSLLVLIN